MEEEVVRGGGSVVCGGGRGASTDASIGRAFQFERTVKSGHLRSVTSKVQYKGILLPMTMIETTSTTMSNVQTMQRSRVHSVSVARNSKRMGEGSISSRNTTQKNLGSGCPSARSSTIWRPPPSDVSRANSHLTFCSEDACFQLVGQEIGGAALDLQ